MSLDERIVNELKTLHGKLSAEGKLLSIAQLDKCYDRFRQRFLSTSVLGVAFCIPNERGCGGRGRIYKLHRQHRWICRPKNFR